MKSSPLENAAAAARYEGTPYAELSPEAKAQLDVDVRTILDEADRLTAQMVGLTDDQVEVLDGEEWASIIAHGPPR